MAEKWAFGFSEVYIYLKVYSFWPQSLQKEWKQKKVFTWKVIQEIIRSTHANFIVRILGIFALLLFVIERNFVRFFFQMTGAKTHAIQFVFCGKLWVRKNKKWQIFIKLIVDHITILYGDFLVINCTIRFITKWNCKQFKTSVILIGNKNISEMCKQII